MAQHSMQGSFPVFDASDFQVGIVCAQYNFDISSRILQEALETLETYNVLKENVTVIKVPGCIEIPVMLQTLAKEKHPNALVALGAIIQGETNHFEYVARIACDGILRVALDNNVPIGFGVLTCATCEQALSRVTIGKQAVEAALHSAREHGRMRS